MKKALLITLIITLLLTVDIKAKADEPIFIYVLQVSAEFELDPYILGSLVYQESRFLIEDNLTQITNKKWFKRGIEYTGNDDITDQYNNIRICGYYLGVEWNHLPMERRLMAWNMGYDKAVKQGEVSRYAQEIMNRAETWKKGVEESGRRNKKNVITGNSKLP